jgi:hypothetical protein
VKHKTLAAAIITAALVFSGASAAYANGPIAPSITYKIIDKTVSTDWYNLLDRVGNCDVAQAGAHCTISEGKTAESSFGTTLGITVDQLSAALDVSSSKSVETSVSCESPALPANGSWYAYAEGTLYTYKVEEIASIDGASKETTSGWETTFKPLANAIYCTTSS